MFLRITAGRLKGRRLTVPDTTLRPTEEKVRAALFNTLFAMKEFEGALFLDLFAGSGAVGIEALSRGCARTIFVDRDRRMLAHLQQQLALLDVAATAEMICADSFTATLKEKLSERVDIIFIDPPYDDRDRIPELVRRCIEEGIVADHGVIVTESDTAMPEQIAGWGRKEKRYGGTFLSFYTGGTA
ncbi:MAG TPA: 16S rRNA (guanine(966)-N(2))-methyltransferase RsmD [bacterium]|nr:16S rRNA (guanine(966)-N(2))-methyltransferase RsmD [bacterium]